MSTLAPLRTSVLVDRAYEVLKEAILTLELAPGTRLVERHLAEQLGVSKSPVRDALQRLTGEGLIEQTPYAGMVVRTYDAAFVDELYVLREVLEVTAVELATPRLTEQDALVAEASFRQAEEAMRSGDNAGRGAAATRFHEVFYRRSGNRPLQNALNGLSDIVRIISALNWQRHDTRWQSHRQHQAIFEAARGGDVEGAASRMRQHIQLGRTEYRRALEQPPTPG